MAGEALIRPLRVRILESMAEPASAAAVARKLGVARQKVHYHLKQLEQEGLVELVEERKKGNCTERIVRATARTYLVGAEAIAKLAKDPAAAKDRFSSAYLTSVAADAVRDVARLRDQAEQAKKRLPTLTLETEVRFGSAAARSQFFEALSSSIAQLVAHYHDQDAPGGRRFRLILGAYPAPPKE
jgi:DNA-binding transcriptional ArsR family regulator